MSNRHGYIGTVGHTQAIKSNSGVFSPNEVIDLDSDNVWFNAGQLELIETKTVSSSANVDFTDLGSYNIHFFTFNNMHCSDNKDLNCRVLVGGSVQTGASDYARAIQACADSYFYEDADPDLDRYRIIPEVGGNSPECFNGTLYMYNAIDSTKYTFFTQDFNAIIYNGKFLSNFGSGAYMQTNQLSGVRFYMSSDNINSGDISLYGIKEYS